LAGSWPEIIQGDMGAGVSGWPLARAVARRSQLGVVSGTALDLILVRRLQNGDPGGHLRRALAAFPDPARSDEILHKYFVPGGRQPGEPFAGKPMVGERPDRALGDLLVIANFAEVFLAREGHAGPVGINFLHKVQPPLLPALFGALLAGVDAVLVGAGIPLEIPGVLDRLCAGEPAAWPLQLRPAAGSARALTFEPPPSMRPAGGTLKRPKFIPIVSSATLANLLVKKCPGRVDGFVVESQVAGGHNAPPRGGLKLTAAGEPVYGPRDEADLAAFRALNVPFWLAGGRGSPEQLARARSAGAAGIQVGTLFAFCEESGLRDDLKAAVIGQCRRGTPHVFQDPLASPTGFPFQVLALPGTLSEREPYEQRARQCDLGYLREAYETPEGAIGWRCAAEDPAAYVRKGGRLEETVGRKCLCNSLMANIGLAQLRAGVEELPLVTSGRDLSGVARVLGPERTSYSADDVLDLLLSRGAEGATDPRT
jgi:nitronate monooxygenase